jgi:hypothetical protein
VAPSHGQRGKGAERIDDADALPGVGYLHFTAMLNGGLHPSSITCHRGL